MVLEVVVRAKVLDVEAVLLYVTGALRAGYDIILAWPPIRQFITALSCHVRSYCGWPRREDPAPSGKLLDVGCRQCQGGAAHPKRHTNSSGCLSRWKLLPIMCAQDRKSVV